MATIETVWPVAYIAVGKRIKLKNICVWGDSHKDFFFVRILIANSELRYIQIGLTLNNDRALVGSLTKVIIN